MVLSLLPRASAAVGAAVFAARRRGLGTEPTSDKTQEKSGGGNWNFVCSPLAIVLVFAIAMRGARGRTVTEMERLLPLRGLPALLRLTTYSNKASGRGGEDVATDTDLESDDYMGTMMGTEFDVVSRMYVDGRLESNSYFRGFKDELLRECSNGDEQNQQLAVELIDCTNGEETARRINAFIGEVTRGRITDLVSLDLITPLTRLVLVSAAFFRAAWRTPFREEETEKAPFYALPGSNEDKSTVQEAYDKEGRGKKSEKERGDQSPGFLSEREPRLVVQSVDTMRVLLKPPAGYYFRVDDAVTAVGLPYDDEDYVLYVVQPNDPRNLESLMRFRGEHSEESAFPTLDDVVQSMREGREEMEDVEVELSLPKFALKAADNSQDLIPVFHRLLRIQAPFDRRVADFSGISGDRTLLISGFVHQAEIEVDEKGTVATAAAMAAIAVKMAFIRMRRVSITINQPFAFQIRYHPREAAVPRGGEEGGEEGAAASDARILGDYVLFTGCVTDALAAQQ